MTALAELPGYDLPDGHVAVGTHTDRKGHTVIASGERFWGAAGKITLGGVLLASAGLLLLSLAAAMGIVSWHAQFAFIYAVKHQRLAASLEALGLDCGAVVFSILGIALARLGRRAVIERALVCICAAGSCAMNAAGSDLGSPRSVAAFVMPPLLFAITSDRLISVIRRSALGRLDDAESQRSAWRLAGTAVLYLIRFALAPPSTAKGLRQAVLNATPVPSPDDAPAQLPGSAPAALAASKTHRPERASGKRTCQTKAGQLVAKAAEHHDLAVIPLDRVSAIASGIAAEIDLHPGTARRVLLGHVRALQDGGQAK